MKVLYDHQIFSLQKYGGISKYFCELMKHLPDEVDYDLSILFSYNQYLKENKDLFRKRNVPFLDKKFKGNGFLKKRMYDVNKLYSKFSLRLNKYDLLHPTYFDSYFQKNLKKAYVITVHDLIEFKFKEQFKQRPLMAQMEGIIKNARRLIAISENTKKDIIDVFNIKPDTIDVVYHGFTRHDNIRSENPYGNYILFVGKRNGYKNFCRFAKAASVILKKDKDLNLICAGLSFNKGETELLRNLGIAAKVRAMGVDENELQALYSHAKLFVYPSLYEGFGMPILEAFANRCPVCLSNSSCLPEIAGNAAAYFDPNDEDSMVSSMEKVITDSVFSNNLEEAGNLRLQSFSWEQCAKDTAECYKKAIAV